MSLTFMQLGDRPCIQYCYQDLQHSSPFSWVQVVSCLPCMWMHNFKSPPHKSQEMPNEQIFWLLHDCDGSISSHQNVVQQRLHARVRKIHGTCNWSTDLLSCINLWAIKTQDDLIHTWVINSHTKQMLDTTAAFNYPSSGKRLGLGVSNCWATLKFP